MNLDHALQHGAAVLVDKHDPFEVAAEHDEPTTETTEDLGCLLRQLVEFAFVDGLRPRFVARRVNALLRAAGVETDGLPRVPQRYGWRALSSPAAANRFRRCMTIVWRRERFCVPVPDVMKSDDDLAAEARALVAENHRRREELEFIARRLFCDWSAVRVYWGAPGALVRTALVWGRTLEIPPANSLSATDIGEIFGETKAAASARLKEACSRFALAGGRAVYLGGMKSASACEKYALAQRGNTNRRGKYARC